MATKLKIEERIALVKKELVETGISKDRKTKAQGQYAYRGVDATMAIVSSLHVKYGINFLISDIKEFNVTATGSGVHIYCLMCFSFYSSDDKSDLVSHWVIGEGKDMQDKSSGKAHSYAYKNGMFSFYEIPVAGQSVDDYDPRIDNETSDDNPPHVPASDLSGDSKKKLDEIKAELEKAKPVEKKPPHATYVQHLEFFMDYFDGVFEEESKYIAQEFAVKRGKFIDLCGVYQESFSEEQWDTLTVYADKSKALMDKMTEESTDLQGSGHGEEEPNPSDEEIGDFIRGKMENLK